MATINKTSELPIAKAIGFSLNSTNVLSINELSPSSRRFYLKIIAKAIILDSICAGTSTVVSGKCTVLFTRSSDTAGTIAFSNVTDDVAFSISGEPADLSFTLSTSTGAIHLDRKATKTTYTNLTATFEYSKDGGLSWTDYSWGSWESNYVSTGEYIYLGIGDTVYFRAKGTDGKNDTMSYSAAAYYYFVCNTDEGESVLVNGNVMSLLDASMQQTSVPAYAFCNLFKNLDTLTAPALPATTLASGCYYGMFRNCTSLTTAPALPATELAQSCYSSMFYGCTSLTTAPALPATTLAEYCYQGMFHGCTSLTTAPALPATTLAENCYNSMFFGDTSLTTAPVLPATTLALKSYYQMFKGCTALTTVPALKVTTLAERCYESMFNGCTALQVSDTQTEEAQYAWNIPTSGTFTNETQYDQANMFLNCLGTRSSSAMSGAYGESHTYYTQNPPVQ